MKSNSIKVVFFITDLNVGGAERVLLNILKYIDRDRFAPILILLNNKGALLSSVPRDVNIYYLDNLTGKCSFILLLQKLWKFRKLLIELNPQIVFSLMWYPNAIALITRLMGGLSCKFIISERTSTLTYKGKFINLIRRAILRFLYPMADKIITPSKQLAYDLAVSHGLSKEILVTIHNPVDVRLILDKSLEEVHHQWFKNDERVISAIGRLGSEKGFIYLIKAMAILKRSSIDCKLMIVGEGNERKLLEILIHELQLEDRVDLVGYQENPYKYLSRSIVFVLSSIYEGFPNALLEALSLGIPSIATRCPTGPDEIITDGINGLLVPPADEQALAMAIKILVADANMRTQLSANGKTRSECFAVELIVKQYENVFVATHNI